MNAFVRSVSLRALAFGLVALASAAGHAAEDCLEPLGASAAWSCRAHGDGGQTVQYCVERTNVFGADPASRFFKMVGTGPYVASCSCRAKGNLPGADFGADKTYLCLDRATDTVITGKITKRKMAGQMFNVSAAVRSVFSCEPDPACDVPPVVDPDLTPESGALPLVPNDGENIEVAASGEVALGYLPGCGGYASEAPTLVFEASASGPGSLAFRFQRKTGETDDGGILVVTPSGAAHCADYEVELPHAPGSYALWVRAKTPGAPVEGYLQGFHSVP